MRLYQWLLWLYPASFRAEYGDDMLAIFAERRAAATGPMAVARLWAATIRDVVSSAAGAHADMAGQDIRLTVRGWRRSPGFALTVVAVSALGIGATAAAFAVTDHVLVRPLPFDQPDRLVRLYQDQSFRGYSRMELSPPNFLDYQRASRSFAAIGAYSSTSGNLVGTGEPLRLTGARVTGSVFTALRAAPALGRTLTSADDGIAAPATLVIGYGLWMTRFAGDADVLGRSVLLDDVPHTIVGVMPATFNFPSRDTAYWAPLRFSASQLEDRTNWYLDTVARLADDVSLAQARAEVQGIAAQLAQAYPDANARNGATLISLRDEVTRQARLTLWALAGASVCMLLIACANLASLLLSRALDRHRELSVRAALGAGRERLVRQMMTENMLLTAGGGVAGVALALAVVPFVNRLVPVTLPIQDTPAADGRLLVMGLLITVVTGLVLGLWPALSLTSSTSLDGLKDGMRAGVGRATERARGLLVVAEITASMVLLVCAGLLLQALWRVQAVDPGFQSTGVVTMTTSLPMPAYEATAVRERFYQRVLDEARRLPGVTQAGYISFLPMVMRGGIWPVRVDDALEDPESPHTASLRFITPGLFETLGVPLLRGRDIADTDRPESRRVAVVSDSFARLHWPSVDPLGRRVSFAFGELEVVGVVGDIKVRGLERESEPQIYLASAQTPDGNLIFYSPRELVVRADGDLQTLVPQLRAIVSAADARVPVSDIRPLAAVVEADSAARSVQVRVLAAFAATAVVLAALGVHGLLAFMVSSRTREIGVRLALGATPGRILAQVVTRGLRLAAAGAIAGGIVSWWAGSALQALLFGVSPHDTTVYAVAVGACALMTLAGCAWPAFRAAKIDPMEALRVE